MEKHKQEMIVHCSFTQGGENAQDIIFNSFRAFLYRNLEKVTFF